MNNEVLSFSRLTMLIRARIVENKKAILLALLFVFLLGITMLSFAISYHHLFAMLVIVGLVLTVRECQRLHQHHLAYQYFLLPISNLERFLLIWLVTAVLFPLILVFTIYAISWVKALLNLYFFSHPLHPVDPWQWFVWRDVLKYIVVQSVFLLGAIYFKRYAVMKMAFALACFFSTLFILTLAAAYVTCPTCQLLPHWTNALIHVAPFLYFCFWVLLAPACLVMSYVRLSECELR